MVRMPTVNIRLLGRDDANSTTDGPGQRISVNGGIDSKRNIIAMIFATVLFIFVLVLYQYFSTVMAQREEQEKTRIRHGRRKTQPDDAITSKVSKVVKRWISLLKRIVSPPSTRTSCTSSSNSMEALLKVTPRRPPKRKTFAILQCLTRYRQSSKAKREARRIPRPLLLSSDRVYSPRSPIDERTQELLRTPDAFAEYSDPVRNMNFARLQDEIHRRKEHDEIWYEEPIGSPEKPGVACVAPLAFRKNKKTTLVREGVDTDSEWAQPSPERVIYPTRQLVVPPSTTPQSPVHDTYNSFYGYPPYSPNQLSVINEGSEPSTPRSFFEIDEDEKTNDTELPRNRIRLRFPLPSPTKAAVQTDIDAFSIGSYSVSDDASDGSGH